MSPFNFDLSSPFVFGVAYDGSLGDVWLGEASLPGVRPVINLCADAQITSAGTVDDPFQVVGAS